MHTILGLARRESLLEGRATGERAHDLPLPWVALVADLRQELGRSRIGLGRTDEHPMQDRWCAR